MHGNLAPGSVWCFAGVLLSVLAGLHGSPSCSFALCLIVSFDLVQAGPADPPRGSGNLVRGDAPPTGDPRVGSAPGDDSQHLDVGSNIDSVADIAVHEQGGGHVAAVGVPDQEVTVGSDVPFLAPDPDCIASVGLASDLARADGGVACGHGLAACGAAVQSGGHGALECDSASSGGGAPLVSSSHDAARQAGIDGHAVQVNHTSLVDLAPSVAAPSVILPNSIHDVAAADVVITISQYHVLLREASRTATQAVVVSGLIVDADTLCCIIGSVISITNDGQNCAISVFDGRESAIFVVDMRVLTADIDDGIFVVVAFYVEFQRAPTMAPFIRLASVRPISFDVATGTAVPVGDGVIATADGPHIFPLRPTFTCAQCGYPQFGRHYSLPSYGFQPVCDVCSLISDLIHQLDGMLLLAAERRHVASVLRGVIDYIERRSSSLVLNDSPGTPSDEPSLSPSVAATPVQVGGASSSGDPSPQAVPQSSFSSWIFMPRHLLPPPPPPPLGPPPTASMLSPIAERLASALQPTGIGSDIGASASSASANLSGADASLQSTTASNGGGAALSTTVSRPSQSSCANGPSRLGVFLHCPFLMLGALARIGRGARIAILIGLLASVASIAGAANSSSYQASDNPSGNSDVSGSSSRGAIPHAVVGAADGVLDAMLHGHVQGSSLAVEQVGARQTHITVRALQWMLQSTTNGRVVAIRGFTIGDDSVFVVVGSVHHISVSDDTTVIALDDSSGQIAFSISVAAGAPSAVVGQLYFVRFSFLVQRWLDDAIVGIRVLDSGLVSLRDIALHHQLTVPISGLSSHAVFVPGYDVLGSGHPPISGVARLPPRPLLIACSNCHCLLRNNINPYDTAVDPSMCEMCNVMFDVERRSRTVTLSQLQRQAVVTLLRAAVAAMNAPALQVQRFASSSASSTSVGNASDLVAEDSALYSSSEPDGGSGYSSNDDLPPLVSVASRTSTRGTSVAIAVPVAVLCLAIAAVRGRDETFHLYDAQVTGEDTILLLIRLVAITRTPAGYTIRCADVDNDADVIDVDLDLAFTAVPFTVGRLFFVKLVAEPQYPSLFRVFDVIPALNSDLDDFRAARIRAYRESPAFQWRSDGSSGAADTASLAPTEPYDHTTPQRARSISPTLQLRSVRQRVSPVTMPHARATSSPQPFVGSSASLPVGGSPGLSGPSGIVAADPSGAGTSGPLPLHASTSGVAPQSIEDRLRQWILPRPFSPRTLPAVYAGLIGVARAPGDYVQFHIVGPYTIPRRRHSCRTDVVLSQMLLHLQLILTIYGIPLRLRAHQFGKLLDGSLPVADVAPHSFSTIFIVAERYAEYTTILGTSFRDSDLTIPLDPSVQPYRGPDNDDTKVIIKLAGPYGIPTRQCFVFRSWNLERLVREIRYRVGYTDENFVPLTNNIHGEVIELVPSLNCLDSVADRDEVLVISAE